MKKMDIVECKQHIYSQKNEIVSTQHVITSWSSLLQDMEQANGLRKFKKEVDNCTGCSSQAVKYDGLDANYDSSSLCSIDY